MRNAVISSSLLLAALAGCPDRTISEVNPSQGRVEYKDIPVNLNRNVDILFVIDDSGSMADKQNNLAANFPNFIDVLNTIQGGLPDVHIGVVSSDMGVRATDGNTAGGIPGCTSSGKNGTLQLGQATGMVTDQFISDIKLPDGTRQINYTGQLNTVFGAMAKLGAMGCGFEQHLHAMRRALEANANPGFVRPDAFLAVIFIADEDDCSAKSKALFENDGGPLGPLQSFRCTRFGVLCDTGGADTGAMNNTGVKSECHPNDSSAELERVSAFVDFLKMQKPDPTQVIVAGIIGTTAPFAVEDRVINGVNQRALAHSCTYTGGGQTQVADPPTRIQFFLDQFPNRSTSTTICQQDLSGGLQLIAQLLKTVIGDPCITGNLADVDPDQAGDQYDCSASYVQNYGKPNQTETVLPYCNDALSNKPCFHLISDPVKCPTNSNLILKVEENMTAPTGTHLIANCVTEAI
ncbi:MAG TPA: hypothetical protein VIU61_11855 [Kofleriaceae bacterium]